MCVLDDGSCSREHWESDEGFRIGTNIADFSENRFIDANLTKTPSSRFGRCVTKRGICKLVHSSGSKRGPRSEQDMSQLFEFGYIGSIS